MINRAFSPYRLSYFNYLITGVFVSVLLFSCQNDIKEIRAITDPNALPFQTSYNAEYRLTRKGKKSNFLKAAQLDQFQGDENYLMATGGYEILFYDSLGNQEASLTAQTGKYLEKEKTMVSSGNVILSNREGAKLETEEITFYLDSALIRTDKFVTITTENGSILRGNGLVSNDSFTKYKILQPKGELYVNENE